MTWILGQTFRPVPYDYFALYHESALLASTSRVTVRERERGYEEERERD